MKDLLIGNTSQLAYYWPKDDNIDIISSYNINIDKIKKECYNRIYIAFANGKTFNNNFEEFFDTNCKYTIDLIDKIKDYCNKIIYYSTTELWNQHEGQLDLKGNMYDTFNYDKNSNYIRSKEVITTHLLVNKEKYRNVIILFPFSFHSPIRKEKRFLFSKIFDSIINEKKITIGDITNTYRDIIHPKYVIRHSRIANKHSIIGSGNLVDLCMFFAELYNYFDMNFWEYVKMDQKEYEENNLKVNRNTFWKKTDKILYSYDELFQDTIEDIKREKLVNGTL